MPIKGKNQVINSKNSRVICFLFKNVTLDIVSFFPVMNSNIIPRNCWVIYKIQLKNSKIICFVQKCESRQSSDFLRSTHNLKKYSWWFWCLLSKSADLSKPRRRFFSNFVCFSESPNFTAKKILERLGTQPIGVS